MRRSSILATTMLTTLVFSLPAAADDRVYADFPVTVKGYTGDKTSSVAYTGQIARHALHDSLKKLAGSETGAARKT